MSVKKLFTSISLVLALIGAASGLKTSASDSSQLVTWDQYTLKINGERQFIFSGEFHYYRLPSPDLWDDIFEKFKALGFNTASIYFYWGYHSPKQGIYDFKGVRDLSKLLNTAKKYGINVITRAGPYINAEVSSGGYPGWLTTMKSKARVGNPEYEAAWKEWLTEVDNYLVPNQIHKGGAIILNQIENEYAYHIDPSYMQAIADKFREDGMIVPSTFNDPWPGDHFARGEGSVDIYGWDGYPVQFDCRNPDIWPVNASTYYREFHAKVNPTEPMALYEFQGGAFDPWGGPGYENCRKLVNEQFAKVFYKNNYAQGATIQNLYMAYGKLPKIYFETCYSNLTITVAGGTSWGESPTSSVYTSYDYGAPISEARMMTTKAYEIKLQATFLRDVKPFMTTANITAEVDNLAIRVDGLKDVSGATTFYVVQHQVTNTTNVDKFHIGLDTIDGKFAIPRKPETHITLNGRDAKILTACYDFGSQHLLYSTSEIFTHIKQDSRDVILVYAYENEDGEFAITSESGDLRVYGADSTVSSTFNKNVLQINYNHPDGNTYISTASATDGNEILLIVAGYSSASRWWAPQTSEGQSVLVSGPYLVRSAGIEGGLLSLTGDTDFDTKIEIIVSQSVNEVTWNGVNVIVKPTQYGTLTGQLPGPEEDIKIPDMEKAIWKYSPASPETANDFNDSNWVAADHQTTSNPWQPITLPVLYADDYGYHTGSLWFRGKFKATSGITGLKINATMGPGSVWVAWLNDEYLGGMTDRIGEVPLNESILRKAEENVISLLMWTTGHQEDFVTDDEFKMPRGFSEVSLIGSQDTNITWKVQGNKGGEDIADTVRGALNEGGLYGERMGWHLPEYSDEDWEDATVPDTKNRSGVSWYRTSFGLDFPKNYDVPMGIRFTDAKSDRYRALLFINGWQLGKYANDLGPQTLFYLPEGLLNHNGKNTLAIGVIAVDKEVTLGKVTLEPYGKLLSSKPTVGMVESPSYIELKSV